MPGVAGEGATKEQSRGGSGGEVETKNRGGSVMDEKEWVRCHRCDGEIYEGAEYYQINGECVCR